LELLTKNKINTKIIIALMMMKNQFAILIIMFVSISIGSCTGKKQSDSQTEVPPKVSVHIVYPTQGNIVSYITVNGKTIYLKKDIITAPFSGYVTRVTIHLGDRVKKNQALFTLATKEEQALSSSSGLSNSVGKINLLSPLTGFISDLSITTSGAYVTEGSTLGSVAESKQAIIQVNIPFEYHALLKQNATCLVKLPDATSIKGDIIRILPTIDPVSQTQTIFIQPLTNRLLPENLNVTVQFVNTQHSHALLLPKTAILTNETQDHFWVMKVIHDTLAIKIPVVKGIENDSVIEILNSTLSCSDPVITDGGYGLADSTVVKIAH